MRENFTGKRTFRIRLAVLFLISILFWTPDDLQAQQSVARRWNEVLLEAIRNDLARPTVHARNLFQISAAMYDAWAAYDPASNTWLLGKLRGGYFCPFLGVPVPADLNEARNKAISYAAYRLIVHRFELSPGALETINAADELMAELGYDPAFSRSDYNNIDDPAALGNYIAQSMIEFGFQDGSNEQDGYRNQHYEPTNPPMLPKDHGNPFIIDPNRWQPLFLDTFIDQSGNEIPVGLVDFLSPEWGKVVPFALRKKDLIIYERDSSEYWVYHDPGDPPYLLENELQLSAEYQWGFSLVAIWSSHLDHNDGVMWDISPASIGNFTTDFPTTIPGLRSFYDQLQGGDISTGHQVNPATGSPYEPQIVPRGDYSRVLAEFWADGPASETPPGHWFVILNYVSDHPLLEKRFKGTGPVLDDLEWDVKSYFVLGGAVHDAAVTAWGIKGWYDYIRPVSAIRYMADQGQSTDDQAANYSPFGIPLEEGYVEVVQAGDPLQGAEGQHIGKIKIYTWRGPDYITDPITDFAGVGWILAEDWWPYQRPTFVTPPFAGYISGHSTFSRAAAEVLTMLTGDPFFPGGMGEFLAPKNEFLVFEEGPSVDVVLQWATYRDASDQTSLSRIWGGIHPPADDIPGRIIGEQIGIEAFNYAEKYFNGLVTWLGEADPDDAFKIYPNPVNSGDQVLLDLNGPLTGLEIYDVFGNRMPVTAKSTYSLSTQGFETGIYLIRVRTPKGMHTTKLMVNK